MPGEPPVEHGGVDLAKTSGAREILVTIDVEVERPLANPQPHA